jgi:hypothetical protein
MDAEPQRRHDFPFQFIAEHPNLARTDTEH